ncbi:MAG: phosphopantothenoylcysteine decarboxylase/phosphopantothenate--cysteine ligase [Parvicellaceae bacterium]|jgi:phosphopantothenoylcysteine decarboxylase/phosphopantothenate--cysteine ligase
MLRDKNVVLCVTGSIAAYKAAQIIRLLIKSGASVKVIMTEAAKEFITPLTLGTLSKEPVLTDFAKDYDQGVWNNHVDLGIWADLILVAPATANTISKMSNGEADSLLLAVYLSARCPVFVAPAMDLDMFKHGSTKDNLDILISRGNHIIEPGVGELASGLTGKGRLAEPEEIISFLESSLKRGLPLEGKSILVTAGPTIEAIDPVRFISNRSSGKMGYAIARAAYDLGADVTLVSGPTNLDAHPSINCIKIESAKEMYQACMDQFPNVDAVIMAAAVADYTPSQVAKQKMKKSDDDLSIPLSRTEDILKTMGASKKGQVLVGFAMETENGIDNAKAKIVKKNLDFIVYNSLNDTGAGFQHDSNKITIIGKDNKMTNFELKSKQEVAKDVVHELIKHF